MQNAQQNAATANAAAAAAAAAAAVSAAIANGTQLNTNSNSTTNNTRKREAESDGKQEKETKEERRKRRKTRWSGSEHDKTFIPGMPTVLPTNLTPEQEKAYLFQLQIEEISRKLRTGDLGIPLNPEERFERNLHTKNDHNISTIPIY